jgi:purine-binding chemotaxis protein CheW
MTTADRYICFNLGEEEFAIPLLSVREVIRLPEVTKVPQTPPYFLGIMNLRGSVISVMDLRLKMGVKSNQSGEATVIILDLGDYSLGVLVDKVNSVVMVDEKTLSQKPELGSSPMAEAIRGVFRKDNNLTLILDIAKALSVEDHTAASKKFTEQKAG